MTSARKGAATIQPSNPLPYEDEIRSVEGRGRAVLVAQPDFQRFLTPYR